MATSTTLHALLFATCTLSACGRSRGPTDEGKAKTTVEGTPPTSARDEGPALPALPERLPQPSDWQELPAAGTVTTLGRLPHFGAFVGGQGDEGRWVVKLGVDGSSERIDFAGPKEVQVVAETPGGELIVGGIAGEGLDAENWFARVGVDGKVEHAHTFSTTLGSDDWRGIMPFGAGAVMFGSYGVHEPGTTPGWILVVGRQGITADLHVGKEFSHELRCGVPLADGGLMAFGDVWLKEPNTKVPWLVLVGADGSAGREIAYEDDTWSGVRTAAMGADGLVYAAGNSVDGREQLPGLEYFDGGKLQVLKVDTKGELKWRHRWLEDVALVGSMIARPEREGAGVVLLVATTEAGNQEMFHRGRELLLVQVPPDGSTPVTRPVEIAAPLLRRSVSSTALLGVRDSKVLALELESTNEARTSYRWRFAAL